MKILGFSFGLDSCFDQDTKGWLDSCIDFYLEEYSRSIRFGKIVVSFVSGLRQNLEVFMSTYLYIYSLFYWKFVSCFSVEMVVVYLLMVFIASMAGGSSKKTLLAHTSLLNCSFMWVAHA